MDYRKLTIDYVDNILKDYAKAKIIEQSIHRYVVDYYVLNHSVFKEDNSNHIQKYIHTAKKILQTIEHLKLLILEDKLEFPLSEIAFQPYTILDPEKWTIHIKKKQINKDRIENKPQATTDQFTCGKCHQKKCTYYEVQIRGADEPATVFITCMECGNKWRQ